MNIVLEKISLAKAVQCIEDGMLVYRQKKHDQEKEQCPLQHTSSYTTMSFGKYAEFNWFVEK